MNFCPTGKQSYPSPNAAWRVIRFLTSKTALHTHKYNGKSGGHAYRCRECGQWHDQSPPPRTAQDQPAVAMGRAGMSDIRIDVDFDTNPKIIKLKRRVGDTGLLCLIRLWCYAAKHRSDGVLTDMDAEDIAIACGWQGNEQDFITTLEQLRLIDQAEEGTYALHNWEQRNPWAAHSEERSDLARKAVKARWNKRNDTERIRNVYGANAEANTERNTPSPAPSPSPTPSPSPSPIPKEQKAKSKAKERAPAQATPLPTDFAITPELQAWADAKGYGDLPQHLDSFRDKAQAKGYQYTDWNAAFRNAVRDDWAGLRKPAVVAATPHNGKPGPLISKQDRIAVQHEAALAEWLRSRGPQVNVIEGECHEIH